MVTRLLDIRDLAALRELAVLSEVEGFAFVQRFVDDLTAGRAHLDDPCEFFLGVMIQDELVAIGGVTPDPYVHDPQVGRLRHLYVRREHRGTGVGRTLVTHLEARARGCYAVLRLRTDTEAAAHFYQGLGYEPVTSPAVTHQRSLSTGARAPAT